MNNRDFQKIKKAAEEDHDQAAQYQAGKIYITGSHISEPFVEQDIKKGLQLIRSAAAQGHEPAKAFLYDSEQSLIRMLRRRQQNDIIPVCILLGFVAVLLYFGITTAFRSGWKHSLILSLTALFSVTSCFWVTLGMVFVSRLLKEARSIRGTQKSKISSGSTKSNKGHLFVFLFGCIFIAALLVLAIVFPEPTVYQYTVFRIILALAAAGIAAFVPGMLRVKLNNWLTASGALAVFVIVYFFTPAGLATISQTQIDETTKAINTKPVTMNAPEIVKPKEK